MCLYYYLPPSIPLFFPPSYYFLLASTDFYCLPLMSIFLLLIIYYYYDLVLPAVSYVRDVLYSLVLQIWVQHPSLGFIVVPHLNIYVLHCHIGVPLYPICSSLLLSCLYSSLFYLFNFCHRDQISCSLLGGFSKPITVATQSLDSGLCSMLSKLPSCSFIHTRPAPFCPTWTAWPALYFPHLLPLRVWPRIRIWRQFCLRFLCLGFLPTFSE